MFEVPWAGIAKFIAQMAAHVSDIRSDTFMIALLFQYMIYTRVDGIGEFRRGVMDKPGAAQRKDFPAPGLLSVIPVKSLPADRHRPGPARGTQFHVDGIECALAGLGTQGIDKAPGEAGII